MSHNRERGNRERKRRYARGPRERSVSRSPERSPKGCSFFFFFLSFTFSFFFFSFFIQRNCHKRAIALRSSPVRGQNRYTRTGNVALSFARGRSRGPFPRVRTDRSQTPSPLNPHKRKQRGRRSIVQAIPRPNESPERRDDNNDRVFKILQRISLRAFLASFYYPVYSRVLLEF